MVNVVMEISSLYDKCFIIIDFDLFWFLEENEVRKVDEGVLSFGGRIEVSR